MDMENIFSVNSITTETSVDLNDSVKKVYIDGMRENLKAELEELGYSVLNVTIEVDHAYENIEEIRVELGESQAIYIEPIMIGEEQESSKDVFLELKQYIAENYQVSSENIHIVQK